MPPPGCSHHNTAGAADPAGRNTSTAIVRPPGGATALTSTSMVLGSGSTPEYRLRNVKHGYKIIDADSHAMEPEDMWDRYLDKKFAAYAPTHKRLAPDFPWFGELQLLGHTFGFTGHGKGLAGPKFVNTDDGEGMTFFDAAYHYIEEGFSAASYL